VSTYESVNVPGVAAELLIEAKLTASDLAVTAFASVNENVAVPAVPVVIAAYVVVAE
jgi:hypothetical protein